MLVHARVSARSIATIASRASTACAASTAPSSTRCGRVVSRSESFSLAGSPSTPFATTVRGPRPCATARSFVAVGNALPPRPRRPLRATMSIRSTARRRRVPTSGSEPIRSRCSDHGSAVGASMSTRGSPVGGSRRRAAQPRSPSSPPVEERVVLIDPLTVAPGMSRRATLMANVCGVGEAALGEASSVPCCIDVIVPAKRVAFVADDTVAVPRRTTNPRPSLVPCSTTVRRPPDPSVSDASNWSVCAWSAPVDWVADPWNDALEVRAERLWRSGRRRRGARRARRLGIGRARVPEQRGRSSSPRRPSRRRGGPATARLRARPARRSSTRRPTRARRDGRAAPAAPATTRRRPRARCTRRRPRGTSATRCRCPCPCRAPRRPASMRRRASARSARRVDRCGCAGGWWRRARAPDRT